MKKCILVAFLTMILAFTGCSKGYKGTNGESESTNMGVNTEGNEGSQVGGETVGVDKDSVKGEEFVIHEDIKLVADKPVRYPFTNVSVHDPSIVAVDGTYYVFGSHLGAAKTTDFMNWTLIGSGVNDKNPLIENVREEMKEALEWAKTDTFWAPDVIQLADGRYYMYYCTCEGSMPLSSLGVAVSDKIEGPYKDLGLILKSGMGADMKSEDGDTYNANIQPNVVDPSLYFDKEGKLWMMYGSYSGGIFVLEMDPNTGFPLESGYGKKILGGNHVRIEGPYVLYSPDTDYYYLFLSYGGLGSDGGYNIRVARSKNPDGPYYDANGVDMIECKGANGSFFSDASIYKYGVKLMGNFRFAWVEGESTKIRTGYVSPGHNSAYYDDLTGKYFLIFHTRFEAKGEAHEVRVHQMYMNEDGWPVVSPYRYVGETMGTYMKDDIVGYYKYINHGNAINTEVTVSELIQLGEDNKVSGIVTGTWDLKDDGKSIEIIIGEDTYKGLVNIALDEQGKKNVMTFTALSEKGIAIWGSGLEAIE
jgi:arabinan endo-1,5-alpha-L-arabinosidase